MSSSVIDMTFDTRGIHPSAAGPAFRTPKRISVTLPYAPYKALEERSTYEGRSLSNLAAFLIEEALDQEAKKH
jgi:hypothetical protein